MGDLNLTDQLRAIAPKFLELGVKSAEAFYSGGGDEGFCEGANYWSGLEQKGTMIEVPDALDLELRDLAFEFSIGLAGSWYNNEGGYGQVNFDFAQPRAQVLHEDYTLDTVHSEALYD